MRWTYVLCGFVADDAEERRDEEKRHELTEKVPVVMRQYVHTVSKQSVSKILRTPCLSSCHNCTSSVQVVWTYLYDSMRSTMSLNMKRSDDMDSTSRMMIANDSSDYRDVKRQLIHRIHETR